MSYDYTPDSTGLAQLDASKPASTEGVSVGDEAIRQIKAYLKDPTMSPFPATVLFPVNSVYLSMSTLDPNDFLPGTWVAISQGRLLLGAGTNTASNNEVAPTSGAGGESFAVGATGGSSDGSSKTVVTGTGGSTALTKAQIPTHAHKYTSPTIGSVDLLFTAVPSATKHTPTSNAGTTEDGTLDGVASGGSGGNGAGHTHGAGSYVAGMFPYFVVNVWLRTA